MITIRTKPLSVNEYQGVNKRPDILKAYKVRLSYLFPKYLDIPDGDKELSILVGFSSTSSDTDNILKPFIDAMAEYYGFNDKTIIRIVVEKVSVPRGEEFISFELSNYCAYKEVHYFRIKNKEYCVAAKMPMGCGSVQYFAFVAFRNAMKSIDITNVPQTELEALKAKLRAKLIESVI